MGELLSGVVAALLNAFILADAAVFRDGASLQHSKLRVVYLLKAA